MIEKFKQLWIKFHSDSLFSNSFYLMLATAVMAGFGFFFWLISARLVPPENIGLATALISVMNVIAIFSLIGFDSSIVRFLAHSKKRNQELNTAIILVGLAAFILSAGFVLLAQHISPKLAFIQSSPLMSLLFILFCIMSAINILTDAVFLAYRQTKYSLIINTIFSFVKMLFPLAFASYGAFGIFAAAAGGQSVGFILSIITMIWKFDYRPQFIVSKDTLKRVWRYSTGNYFAGTLNMIPVTVLPIIITNNLGSKEAAYYYIVMMIGNLLYVIPQATTRSLFAEGSFDEKSIESNIKKSTKIISLFMMPAIAILFIGGKFILNVFGKSYSTDGIQFLYIIAIAGITVSAYAIINTIFRVTKDLQSLIYVNIAYASSIIGLSYLFLSKGLLGIGYAWLLGHGFAFVVGFFLQTKKGRRNQSPT